MPAGVLTLSIVGNTLAIYRNFKRKENNREYISVSEDIINYQCGALINNYIKNYNQNDHFSGGING